jgi:hypothetical protein
MELTKSDLDVIICMLDDIDTMWGMKPEELELKEKIERWLNEEQNK